MPSSIVQTLACLTADPGVVTFVKINHEIISTALLPTSADHERQLSVTGESMCTKYLLL